jgi:hypothetical protein
MLIFVCVLKLECKGKKGICVILENLDPLVLNG